ncbi:hypothetical protein L1987_59328 [Smallanthus sonchifolius]|uniref:Uncharacterized protein n=1 Tax=Smallanthus sonchifolius TaxID=185202 RepID=A0ACB9D4X0_9ASTR|nr:hypothetical protein L1987_59328 [Smallanthus sonchifolius]
MVENLLKFGTHTPLVIQFSPSSRPLFMSSLNSINIHHSPPATSLHPSLLLFSGGTAFNGVVEELKKLTTSVAHVLPVSDDGGSTAEIVRVLGGPAVGDIRSRCLRLSDQSTSEALAVRTLLGYRTVSWKGNILYGKMFQNPTEKPFVLFSPIFRTRSSEEQTSHFVLAMAGARIFFQSLDAAIFLFSRVSQIPTESLVLPVISTNDRLTLGCELWDGTIIRGQNEISHPTSGSLQLVDKVFPTVNPSVLEQLRNVDCIIYGMGSLFTSICPSLVLLGVGEIIAARSCAKPSEYINTVFVPKDSQIPVDIKSLAAEGIVNVVHVESMHDPKVGIVYEPKSLIEALANLLSGCTNKQS